MTGRAAVARRLFRTRRGKIGLTAGLAGMLAVVCWGGYQLARFWTPARVLALYAIGRAPNCGLLGSLRSVKNTATHESAIRRLLKTARLVQNDPSGLELWETEQGPFWILPSSDMPLFCHMLAEQETDVYGAGALGVQPGDIVLDCGANFGVYTRKALKSGASLVVAIEPAPDIVACLQRTFAQEIRQGRVIVYPKGVWDREDQLVLHTASRNPWGDSLVLHTESQGPRVPLTTIDKLVAELQLPRVSFIKMDIEGAERNAIVGAQRTLTRYRPRLAIAVYHRPDDPTAVPSAVWQAAPGYRLQGGPCEYQRSNIQLEVMYFY